MTPRGFIYPQIPLCSATIGGKTSKATRQTLSTLIHQQGRSLSSRDAQIRFQLSNSEFICFSVIFYLCV